MELTETTGIDERKNDETIFTPDDFSVGIYDKHIRQARNAIFIAAGILALNVIILAFNVPEGYDYLWIDLSFWGLFVAGFIALGFWAKKKPYTAIICALILYGMFILINALIDPVAIIKGIIMKIVIVSALIKGLSDAKQAQDMQKLQK